MTCGESLQGRRRRTLDSVRDHVSLAVLGGSSVSTPVLLNALRNSQLRGGLPSLHVRLYGRKRERLTRVLEYAGASLSLRRGAADGERTLRLTAHSSIDEALLGASYVLCMIRPGGMRGRARDEHIALEAGVPADEGLGPGGLACFLRGRPLIEAVLARCRECAPDGSLLMMTSPLGLNVALARALFGPRSYGLCELPIVTSRMVVRHAVARLGCERITHCHAGLNHQSWLYAFRDEHGNDVTERVLASIDSPELVDVDPEAIRAYGAVPVPYLKLFLHRDRVIQKQRSQGVVRGAVLTEWSSRLEAAYCGGDGPDVPLVSALLAERKMDWFEHGVVPVLEALTQSTTVTLPLNVQADASLQGVPAEAVVEVDCKVSSAGARPIVLPALPPRPAALTRELIRYERAALALPRKPSRAQLASTLALHPLTSEPAIPTLVEALTTLSSEESTLP